MRARLACFSIGFIVIGVAALLPACFGDPSWQLGVTRCDPVTGACPPASQCMLVPNAAPLCVTTTCGGRDDGTLCADETVAAGSCRGGQCLPFGCGNGQLEDAESCDDGNVDGGDGCSPTCGIEACGNGTLDAGEECEAADALSNDGCSVCRVDAPQWEIFKGQELGRRVGHRIAQIDTPLLRGFDDVQAVLFGGERPDGAPLADTWVYRFGAWRLQPTLQAPPPRANFAMASVGGVVVLFGGNQGGLVLGDCWLFDGTDWRQIAGTATAPLPPARTRTAMAATAQGPTLFGGTTKVEERSPSIGGSPYVLADTWLFDVATLTWRTVPSIDGPAARASHAMATNGVGDLVMTGGAGVQPPRGTALLDDVWLLRDGKWQRLMASGGGNLVNPQPAVDHASVHDPLRGIVVAGGRNSVDGFATEAYSLVGNWSDLAAGFMWQVLPPLPEPHVGATGFLVDNVVTLAFGAGGEFDQASNYHESELHLISGVAGDGWLATSRTSDVWIGNRVPIAFDRTRNELVAIGQQADGRAVAWVFDGKSWSSQAMPDLRSPQLAYWSRQRKFVLAAVEPSGSELAGYERIADGTWLRSFATTLPGDRNVLLAEVPNDGRLLIAAPAHNQALLVSADGQSVAVTLPFAVLGATPTLTLHVAQQQLYLIGATAWRSSDGVTWTPSTAPPAREDFAVAYDERRQTLVMVGGALNGYADPTAWELRDDVWFPIGGVGVRSRGLGAAYDPNRGAIIALAAATALSDYRLADAWVLSTQSQAEDCQRAASDADGDGVPAATDPDCAGFNQPFCFWGVACDPAAPHCGDGTCDVFHETALSCPADC